METRLLRRDGHRGRILETFLVEWKPFKHALTSGEATALETFLVEWKPRIKALEAENAASLKPS